MGIVREKGVAYTTPDWLWVKTIPKMCLFGGKLSSYRCFCILEAYTLVVHWGTFCRRSGSKPFLKTLPKAYHCLASQKDRVLTCFDSLPYGNPVHRLPPPLLTAVAYHQGDCFRKSLFVAAGWHGRLGRWRGECRSCFVFPLGTMYPLF